MKKSLKLITLALAATPMVAVVSCASKDEDKIVLATDSSSYVENNMDLIPGKIFQPNTQEEGVSAVTINELTSYDIHDDNKDLTDGGFVIYFDNEVDESPTDKIYHADVKDEIENIFVQINKEVNKLISESHTVFLSKYNLQGNKRLRDFYMNYLRYDIDFNEDTNSLNVKVIELPREGTKMALWVEDVVFDELIGIKPVPYDQVDQSGDKGYQMLGGGGVSGYWEISEQFHINQNWIGKSEEDFLNTWHGKRGNESYAYYEKDRPLRGEKIGEPNTNDTSAFKATNLTTFTSDTEINNKTKYDIKMQTRSIIDFNAKKFKVEISFFRGGTIVRNNKFTMPHVEDSPQTIGGVTFELPGGPIEERIVRVQEIPGVFPTGMVNQKSWATQGEDFTKSVNLALRMFEQFETPLQFFLGTSSELSVLKEPANECLELFRANKSKLDWLADTTQDIPQFYQDLYDKICDEPDLDVNAVLPFYDAFITIDSIDDFASLNRRMLGILFNMMIPFVDQLDYITSYQF